jgi:hypothetical protein
MNAFFKVVDNYLRRKMINSEENRFYFNFNLESSRILEAYCTGYNLCDYTSSIAENIREYVNSNYTDRIKTEVESEFKLFCSTRHGSISAYIMGRLYILLNETQAEEKKMDLLSLFVNLTLMQTLAWRIESELLARPHLRYPPGVAYRANWNMVNTAYLSIHSFLAENFSIVHKDGRKVHGWKNFQLKENLIHLKNIFYPCSPTSCFWRDCFFNSLKKIQRTPQIPRPASVRFNNRRKIKNFSENATFSIYFD